MPGYRHPDNEAALPPIDYEVLVFEVRQATANTVAANEALDRQTEMDGFSWAQLGITAWKGVQQVKLLGMAGRAYIKIIKGREYIVFKGVAGSRPNLPGTIYARGNPKVSCFVVGAEELVEDGLKTVRLGIFVYAALDITKEIVSPPPPVTGNEPPGFSLIDLGVHLSCDLLKFALATAAGIAVGMAVTALVVGTTPVIVVFGIAAGAGVVVGMGLEWLDHTFELTDKLSYVCRSLFWNSETARSMVRHGEDILHRGENFVSSEINLIQTWF